MTEVHMMKIFWCLMLLAVSPLMAVSRNYETHYDDGHHQWKACRETGDRYSCYKDGRPIRSCIWKKNTKVYERCPATQAYCNEKARLATAGEVCNKLRETKSVCAKTPPPCTSVQKPCCITEAPSCGPRPRPCGVGTSCDTGCPC